MGTFGPEILAFLHSKNGAKISKNVKWTKIIFRGPIRLPKVSFRPGPPSSFFDRVLHPLDKQNFTSNSCLSQTLSTATASLSTVSTIFTSPIFLSTELHNKRPSKVAKIEGATAFFMLKKRGETNSFKDVKSKYKLWVSSHTGTPGWLECLDTV